jgi:hypothetical protein
MNVKRFIKGYLFILILATGLIGLGDNAFAIPTLQIYIEGATYDALTETWVITTANPFKLWVIGDVGKYGPVYGIKLSAAVSSAEISGGNIALTSTTTTLITDPSTPSNPSPTTNFPSGDGAIPVRGDGTSLPTHGVYRPGTSFFEWYIGNFDKKDSPIGDFITTFPTSFPDTGQVNAYTVNVSGFSKVHFDAYNHIYVGKNHAKYVFAPFSHDGEGINIVPEPATMFIFSSGLGIMGWEKRRRKKINL